MGLGMLGFRKVTRGGVHGFRRVHVCGVRGFRSDNGLTGVRPWVVGASMVLPMSLVREASISYWYCS